jgi:hypothetical protein
MDVYRKTVLRTGKNRFADACACDASHDGGA